MHNIKVDILSKISDIEYKPNDYDNASAEDIKYLIDLAHDTVLKNYNIDMKIEQEFVNWE